MPDYVNPGNPLGVVGYGSMPKKGQRKPPANQQTMSFLQSLYGNMWDWARQNLGPQQTQGVGYWPTFMNQTATPSFQNVFAGVRPVGGASNVSGFAPTGQYQSYGFPYAPQPAPGIAPEGRATTTQAPAFSPFGGVGPFTGEEWANMTRNYSPGGYWTGQGIDYGLSYENLSRGKDTGEPGALNAYGQPIGTPAPFKIRGKGGPQGGARRHIGKPPPTVIIKGKPTPSTPPAAGTGVPSWMGLLSNWTI
jgi:hypothetical protein